MIHYFHKSNDPQRIYALANVVRLVLTGLVIMGHWLLRRPRSQAKPSRSRVGKNSSRWLVYDGQMQS